MDPRLRALYEKLDAFFERGLAAHRNEMECRPGCSACCKRFGVTGIEGEAIAEAVRALDPTLRRIVANQARTDSDACPALVADRCAIYEARPAICRTHGLPIRFGDPDHRSLPLVSACEKNFVGRDLGSLPASEVLDQGTVSTILGALEAARAAASGEATTRIAITELLRGD